MKKLYFIFYLSLINFGVNAQTFNEILGRPTDSTITISILFNQNVTVCWEYGTTLNALNSKTPTYSAAIDTPLEIDFTGLIPNTKYYYRTCYKAIGSSSNFLYGNIHSFHTQRSIGSSFTFTIEADEHLYDPSQGSPKLYQINLANQKKDSGDFMISLGDIFGDDHTPNTTTSAQMKAKHLFYRQYLTSLCSSSPFFICLGNHEGENDFLLNQTPPNNIATYATLWRKFYYPNPSPNAFYSGNNVEENFGMGKPENYYSWTWGDALFVVLDSYRDQCDTSVNPKKWNWSLGLPQYSWFKNVLESSKAKYKFVFAHHSNGQQRGGINSAKYFEWGGYEVSKTGPPVYKFDINRPGWSKPVHQLMVDNHVNIFFQGHDHLFAHETLDGIIYQEVPMAADSTYKSGITDWGSYYTKDTLAGSGHLSVQVSPDCVQVNYILAYLPQDTLYNNKNGTVAFSYSLGTCITNTKNFESDEIKSLNIYPNPFTSYIIINDTYAQEFVQLWNIYGQIIYEGNNLEDQDFSILEKGIYILRINGKNTFTSKLVKE